jgi:hypothetical protein
MSVVLLLVLLLLLVAQSAAQMLNNKQADALRDFVNAIGTFWRLN